MVQEELIIVTTNCNKEFEEVTQMFGYHIHGDKLIPVTAVPKKEDVNKYHLVGATGTNHSNRSELKVLNYDQAMQTIHCDKCEKTIKLEHEKTVKYNVLQVLTLNQVPRGTKLTNFMWEMKNKPSGVYHI